MGKTRLATEVATGLADEFLDGVWFFELAAVADPAAVPDAVAAVLGITRQPGKSVGESVATALEGRSRLLVFDNCEHVVDSVADLVAAILAPSATVKVLATSREGIGVADEQLWRVPSLDVGAAVELFVERAQSMVSDTLADEATAVEDVCRRLDGIPLAIELAASRMASRHRRFLNKFTAGGEDRPAVQGSGDVGICHPPVPPDLAARNRPERICSVSQRVVQATSGRPRRGSTSRSSCCGSGSQQYDDAVANLRPERGRVIQSTLDGSDEPLFMKAEARLDEFSIGGVAETCQRGDAGAAGVHVGGAGHGAASGEHTDKGRKNVESL